VYTLLAYPAEKVLALLGDIVKFPFEQVNHNAFAVHVTRNLLLTRQQARKTRNDVMKLDTRELTASLWAYVTCPTIHRELRC